MERIQELVGRCRVATPSDTVVHSECAFTFFTPFSNGDEGIVVNLNTFAGTIPKLAFNATTKDNNSINDKDIFVRIVKERRQKPPPTTEDGTVAAPTKLAIGVEGGFSTGEDKYEVISKYSVVVLEAKGGGTVDILAELPYNDETKGTFPPEVTKSVESIIHHVGLAVQQDLTAWQDDEEIPISKYYENLPFVDNGVTISPDPKAWKCEKSGATENLWLNLSDGFIGGGRKNWDGSGGSNGALDHFQETGEKYPLVVKLGTINVEGSTVHADCFSYAKDEDGPVKIPNLGELLAKRGIQIAGLQKTEKSTAELEVELNANYAFDAITESGSKLVPVSGPGMQGLQNLGNSCYLNSVVQLLATIPDVETRYGSKVDNDVAQHAFFEGISARSAPNELLVQTTKLVTALTSGKYAVDKAKLEDEEETLKHRIAPRMFKHVIGKDHVDFKTGQQQDAAQFLQYLLEQIDRAEIKKGMKDSTTSRLFAYETEDRIVCSFDKKVKYKSHAAETVWSIRLPMEKARIIPTDDVEPEQKKAKSDGEEKKEIPTLAFSDCLEAWAAETPLDDYRWPHLQNNVHPAMETTRFKNFPRFLWIQVQRYQLGPDWQPIKLEVNLDIPQQLDLKAFRAKWPENDDLVPEESESPTNASPSVEISEVALSMLMDMGFSMNGCKRALTKVGGSDTEAAMNWIFEHNMDPDFNDPLPEESSGAAGASSSGPDDAVVMSLVESLGCFTIDQVKFALEQTQGAADRAADWLFSHMDDLDSAMQAAQSKAAESAGSEAPLDDGAGDYEMVGMISHIGKNTGSGHYVAHIRRDGKWVIYNDEKVAISENPPVQHAYLYLFQRTD